MQHKLLKAFGNNAVADTQQGTATFAKHYASIGDFDAHDPYDGYDDGFSDYGYPDDDYDLEAEQAADEERYWQELAEMEPTKEEWDAIDDEEGRRQAAEDAAEAVLDHVPMGNAKGTRAQLAVAAARF